MKWQKIAIYLLFLIVLLFGLWQSLLRLAGSHANQLVGVVIGGYERFTMLQAKTTLSHIAGMEQAKKLNEKTCEDFAGDLENAGGFFSVLAIGDAEGKPICTADNSIKGPLPTMADRLYFQKVKTADGLVVGEYAISKTTGKPTLHFAYPIKNNGKFVGFVLGGVNLEWYANEEVDNYLGDRNVQVFGVDKNGKLLFGYPHESVQLGANVVPATLVSAILSGHDRPRLLKGFDGHYRVYAYKAVKAVGNEPMVFFVGVSLWTFKLLSIVVIGFILIAVGVLWYGFSEIFKDKKRISGK